MKPDFPKTTGLRREIAARRYCCACLEIMDGSFEKGLERIGTERYEKLVRDVIKALPKVGLHRERGGAVHHEH